MPQYTGPEVVVGVGDCRVATRPFGFIATYALGSCVGVVVYDWKSRVGGLLHAMLPDSSIDNSCARVPTRFSMSIPAFPSCSVGSK